MPATLLRPHAECCLDKRPNLTADPRLLHPHLEIGKMPVEVAAVVNCRHRHPSSFGGPGRGKCPRPCTRLRPYIDKHHLTAGAERPAGADGEKAEEAAEGAQSEAALQAVLGGAIARVVYRNAVAAVPGNVAFRRRFLEALAPYSLPGGSSNQCVHLPSSLSE